MLVGENLSLNIFEMLGFGAFLIFDFDWGLIRDAVDSDESRARRVLTIFGLLSGMIFDWGLIRDACGLR